MLLTNKTVAKHIGLVKKPINPFIYRIHDLPDEEKINSLGKIVKKLGYTIDKKNYTGGMTTVGIQVAF